MSSPSDSGGSGEPALPGGAPVAAPRPAPRADSGAAARADSAGADSGGADSGGVDSGGETFEERASDGAGAGPTDAAASGALLARAAEMLAPRFEPRRVLGRGGMGVVIEARDVALSREVAIKLLPDRHVADPVLRERFLREARACAVLHHPNIVTVHDVDDAAGYIVMELIRGPSLRARLRRESRLSLEEVRRIGRCVLAGLGAAHAAGIVHRDVKPSNILLGDGADGTVKLVDFGVAWAGQAGLTTEGAYVGTPSYMAPEQLRGRVVDARADVYSLGATLFEAVTGEKLHSEERSIEDPARVVRETTGDEALAAAIARAVEEKPERRFTTAAELAGALARSSQQPEAQRAAAETPSVPTSPDVVSPLSSSRGPLRSLDGAGARVARGRLERADEPPRPTSAEHRERLAADFAHLDAHDVGRAGVDYDDPRIDAPRMGSPSDVPATRFAAALLAAAALALALFRSTAGPPAPTSPPRAARAAARGAEAPSAGRAGAPGAEAPSIARAGAPAEPTLAGRALQGEAVRIALLPFKDRTGLPELDFTPAGLPHLLGTELAKVPALHVLGYYRLESHLPSKDAPGDAWIGAARKLGAALAVRGSIEPAAAGRVTVRIDLAPLGAEPLGTWSEEVAARDVPNAVRTTAAAIASRALGRPVKLESRARAFEVQRRLLLGVAELERHRLGEAVRELTAAADADPMSPEAHYALALATWWHSRPAAETERHIARALELGQSDARQAFLEGLKLLLRRRYTEAITHFRRLSERFPDDRDLLYGLSEALFHGGHPREAIAQYQRVAALYPSFRLGVIHALTYAIAQVDEPLMTWALAHATAEHDPLQAAWPPRAKLALRRYDEALAELLAASERNPNPSADDIGGLGVTESLIAAYALSGRHELAEALLARGLAAYPSLTLGAAYGFALARGRTAAAAKHRAALVAEADRTPRSTAALETWTGLIMLELPGEDRARLGASLANVEAQLTADLTGDARYLLLLAMLAGPLDRPAFVERAGSSPFPEVTRAAAAAAAERAGRHGDAGAAWADATHWSGDGRMIPLERFRAAKAFRAARDHEATVRECAEVIEPRLFNWSWAPAVGPCLLWTAEAHAALGRLEASRAAAERLLRLRAEAPAGDELVAKARRIAGPAR